MIFLDTSFLYSLFNAQDDDHLRVREVFEGYRGRRLSDLIVTTPQIIFETITLGIPAVGVFFESMAANRAGNLNRTGVEIAEEANR